MEAREPGEKKKKSQTTLRKVPVGMWEEGIAEKKKKPRNARGGGKRGSELATRCVKKGSRSITNLRKSYGRRNEKGEKQRKEER